MTDAKGLSRFLKQVQAGDWLTPLIEGGGVAEPERWIPPNLEVHPSGAGSPCPREIQLGMLGHRDPVKTQNRRRMDNGTAAHERWTEELRLKGVLHSAGVRLKIDGEWSGEFDLCVTNPRTQSRHLGEIKTINSNGFSQIPKQSPDYLVTAYAMARFKQAYTYQLCQYHTMLRERLGLSDDCFFLFENTDNQSYRIVWVRFDEKMREAAFANSTAARDACVAGVLIPPPFKRQSMACRKCWKELICYRLQDGDQEAEASVYEALRVVSSGGSSNFSEHEVRAPLLSAAPAPPGNYDEEIHFDE